MKRTSLLVVFIFAAALIADAAIAQDVPALTPQQQKLGGCAKDAHTKGLKGADYKSFMSACAKADPTAPAVAAGPTAATAGNTPTPQQDKMKSCNADATAKSLTGDARKTFMSTCLGGASAAH